MFPYRHHLDQLKAAGVPQPEDELHCIMALVLGMNAATLPLLLPADITLADQQKIERAVAVRIQRVPVERIFKAVTFADINLEVQPQVYKPYVETEDALLHTLSLFPDSQKSLRILDLGTGSGFILLALLKALPRASGAGVDINPVAVEAARRNARRNDLEDRAIFSVGDWSSDITEPFDLVISNPPRVATSDIPRLLPEMRDHDPRDALDGGEDGLRFFRLLAGDFRRLVKSQGFGCVQVGQRYAAAALDLFSREGLQNTVLRTNPFKQPSLIVYQNIPRQEGWRKIFSRLKR